MKELHALLDYENVQPSHEALAKLVPGFTDIWLFHGPHQAKQAQQMAAEHDRVTLVPRSGKGPNALDFHLSFYLGYVAAKHPEARLIVVANDKGYDPMIVHAKNLGFAVQRTGFKAKKTVTAPKTPAVPKQTKPAAAKKKPAKSASPMKKPAAKKAPVKKPASNKTVAKKAPSVATVKPRVVAPSVDKAFVRIQKAIAKMGPERPHKLKSFLRHLKAMLGKDSDDAQTHAMVRKLELAKVVHIAGDLVLYGA